MTSFPSGPVLPRLLLAALLLLRVGAARAGGVELSIEGEWGLRVSIPAGATGPGSPARSGSVTVPPPEAIVVLGERHDSLPRFNPGAGGWVKGAQLKGVRAQETTTPFLLDRASLVVRSGADAASEAYRPGEDYEADLAWGTFGRAAAGRIAEGTPVYASYRYFPLRLDALVLTPAGGLELRRGEPRSAAPKAPAPADGERVLAHVWIPGAIPRLAPAHLFPILEDRYPEPPKAHPSVAEQRIPNTFRKLASGSPVRVLAWGDSVTDGGYVPDPSRNRWQEQFVRRLRERFPGSRIELVTEAWGGRNTSSYLGEPPGSPHNYREKVLAAKPDLIVSEFVNDAGFNPDQVEERYSKLLGDFQGIGAEWIILTPHYVRPDWMGLDRERDIDNDPRPYVAGLRAFSLKHGIALAEGSKRYGRLWRQGIPYTTVMLNSINHPDPFGMSLFADALMELFP
ncbi:MAG TPA: hypothetical protein DCM86_17530 [Verrucomicrobiales bacterium]|nr:hypothetical protein [Verrucomicrobiales bacterium]